MASRNLPSRSPISARPGVGFLISRPPRRAPYAGLVLAALLAARCGSGAPRAGPITVTDDAGRAVTLERPATRVVSLSPTFTEILFAIGAGDWVVGRTTWCDYPPPVRDIPSVGDGLPPNVEAVAARDPDLVVLYRSPSTETAARQLEAIGIRTALLRVDLLGDAARATRLLGRLTGRAASADSLARALEAVATAPPATPGGRRPRVAFIVWDAPPIAIGSGSYLHELAERSGADNVFADLPTPSAEISLEALVARDPDALVLLTDSAVPPRFAALPAWRAVRAVRQRRFVYLVGSLYGRPSPRAAAAVQGFRQELARALGGGR